jgi:hypothetical protein
MARYSRKRNCHVAVPTVDAYGDRWVVVKGLDDLTAAQAINKAADYPTRARAMRMNPAGFMEPLFDNYKGAELPTLPPREDNAR